MEEKICSFFGYRDVAITDDLRISATREILHAIEQGCRTFYFGGFSDFDDLCYRIVTSIKKAKSELNLQRIYCVSQERYLTKFSPHFTREKYDKILYLIPSFDGWYKSIYFRNCAMIDQSSYVIFYVGQREDSGAYKAYKYAIKNKGAKIVNIFKQNE